jgi:DNA-packaging protein gp3
MAESENKKWWQRRSQHGRAMIFSSPELMWDAACEYFISEDNDQSWTKTETASFQGEIVQKQIVCKVPYTWQGVALYCHVHSQYFRTFKQTCLKKIKEGIDVELSEDFLLVIKSIDEVIFRQQYNNAQIGVFREGLTARYLKLNDSTQLSTPNGEDKPNEEKEFKITLKLD